MDPVELLFIMLSQTPLTLVTSLLLALYLGGGKNCGGGGGRISQNKYIPQASRRTIQ